MMGRDGRTAAALVRFQENLFNSAEVYNLGDVVEHSDFFAADLVVDHSESRLHGVSPLCKLIFFIDACLRNTAPGNRSFSEVSYCYSSLSFI